MRTCRTNSCKSSCGKIVTECYHGYSHHFPLNQYSHNSHHMCETENKVTFNTHILQTAASQIYYIRVCAEGNCYSTHKHAICWTQNIQKMALGLKLFITWMMGQLGCGFSLDDVLVTWWSGDYWCMLGDIYIGRCILWTCLWLHFCSDCCV